MLPSAHGGTQQGPKKQGGMVYLTNDMLSKQPKAGKILAVKVDTEGKFGTRVVCKLAFDGKTIFYGINIAKNPNYELMTARFGQDENDWVGQGILLGLEKDDFSDQYFVRVSFPKK